MRNRPSWGHRPLPPGREAFPFFASPAGAAPHLVLAAVLTAAPAAHADEHTAVHVAEEIGRAALIGRLVPITGEDRRSVDLTVPFARGSAELAAKAERQLAELGHALAGERLRDFEVGVYGHTDASGSNAYNRTLSEARAAAVVQYLTGRFALDAARFRHAGYGEDRLLEGLDPTSPRHRRVEIVVFAPEQHGNAQAEEDHGRVENEEGRAPDKTGLQAID